MRLQQAATIISKIRQPSPTRPPNEQTGWAQRQEGQLSITPQHLTWRGHGCLCCGLRRWCVLRTAAARIATQDGEQHAVNVVPADGHPQDGLWGLRDWAQQALHTCSTRAKHTPVCPSRSIVSFTDCSL